MRDIFMIIIYKFMMNYSKLKITSGILNDDENTFNFLHSKFQIIILKLQQIDLLIYKM